VLTILHRKKQLVTKIGRCEIWSLKVREEHIEGV